MSSVLVEELGPRGTRRVRIATAVSAVFVGAGVAWLLVRLAQEGQFDGRLWEQFLDLESEWPQFLITGLWGTVRAALGAMVIASILGLFLALGRLARSRVIRNVSGLIVDLFRGPPVLLWIFFSFLALPQLLGVRLSGMQALIVGLSAYNMAVLAEIYRAGILSLDRGQREAAYSIGMPHGMAMRLVILPQALRRMIPAILAQLATLTKDTALGYIIGVDDLMGRGRAFAQGGALNDLQTWFVVGVIYFLLIWGLTRLARRFEIQQRRKLGASRIEVAGGDADLDALGEDAGDPARGR